MIRHDSCVELDVMTPPHSRKANFSPQAGNGSRVKRHSPVLRQPTVAPWPQWAWRLLALSTLLLAPRIAEAKAPWWYLDGFGEVGYTFMEGYSTEDTGRHVQLGLGSTIALRIKKFLHVGSGMRYTELVPEGGDGYCHSIEFPFVARIGIPMSSTGHELRLGVGYGPVQRWKRTNVDDRGSSFISDTFEASIAFADSPSPYYVPFLIELGTRLGIHDIDNEHPLNLAFLRLGMSYR